MHTFRANQGRREAGAGDSGHEEDGRYNVGLFTPHAHRFRSPSYTIVRTAARKRGQGRNSALLPYTGGRSSSILEQVGCSKEKLTKLHGTLTPTNGDSPAMPRHLAVAGEQIQVQRRLKLSLSIHNPMEPARSQFCFIRPQVTPFIRAIFTVDFRMDQRRHSSCFALLT